MEKTEYFFSDSEIESISSDTRNLKKFLDRFYEILHDLQFSDSTAEINNLCLEAYLIFSEISHLKIYNENINIEEINIDEVILNKQSNKYFLKAIDDFNSKVSDAFLIYRKNQISQGIREKLRKDQLFYEISEANIEKIQTLVNQLREQITESSVITQNHRQRLLKKLERLQQELHKKMSDLDRFWGFIGELGIVSGKFGNDVKPLVDRGRELASIVYETEADSAELPHDKLPPNLFEALKK